MLFFYYLNEIKYRVLYFIFSFLFNFFIWLFYSKESLFLIVRPLLNLTKGEQFSYFIFTNMTDVLFIYIKIALILAFVVALPFLFLQVWFFLVQGLYNYEKNFLGIIFFLFIFLFINLIYFLYTFLIPFIWFFFINFELTSSESLFGMYYEARINDYVDFMFYIFFIFCCFLQFPILMIFLLYFNFLKIDFFINYRKYFVILFFVLGGLFSPPDILSQIFISCFILIIYEIILFLNLLLQNYIIK